jgi:cyclopropane-fatty-acyl-phospholipid synthase
MNGTLINLAEAGWLPDAAIRFRIRQLLRSRLNQISTESASDATRNFARQMRNVPVVEAAAEANSQHYEVPSEFFRRVLGKRLKYSCGLWNDRTNSLDDSEEAMLALTCERAKIEDGMDILELGCGWGSLSLWMAEHYPNSRIVAISNSRTQREFITRRAIERGFANLEVLTRNVAEFNTAEQFDRVVSVEMFEHVRNQAELLRRVSGWLTPNGKLFVHIFCHKDRPYAFEPNSPNDWMARHFFTGGIMPSANLFKQYGDDLRVTNQWQVNGTHYAHTSEAWLSRLDDQADDLLELFSLDADRATAKLRLQRWRMFFMACAELFAFDEGNEWFVSHYLFEHSRRSDMNNQTLARSAT